MSSQVDGLSCDIGLTHWCTSVIDKLQKYLCEHSRAFLEMFAYRKAPMPDDILASKTLSHLTAKNRNLNAETDNQELESIH